MSDRFPEISRLKQLEANQTELRLFAIDQAMQMLISAGVQEVVRTVESNTTSIPFEEPESIRGFLKSTRQQLQPPMSQEAMARRSGISLAFYQALEQGKKGAKHSADTLARVAAAANMDEQTALWFAQSHNPPDIVPEAIGPTLNALIPVYRAQIQENGEILRTRKRRNY